ncbi:MAG TPA: nickel-dependent hydrogenase large subunit [Acidobacteriota bacterium]|nr:nickel-dependent hydrogenase large subunit [Acidobacteriota bacterium]
MMARIVVDPITRIEGHLRIEAEVDKGQITKAYSSCTMWRGVEQIMIGRDPRDAWAFTQRICGVCTTVHAFASIRAVEDALGIEVPSLAQTLRNLILATQQVHDHTMHFYHLHALDWVNVPNALKADAKKTSELAQSISKWRNSSVGYFTDLQTRLKKFVESGQLGIFSNAYWGHSAYKLPAEADLLAVAHYLEALDWQRNVIRIHSFLGGKNPHPNFLVGGVPLSVNLSSPAVVNAETLSMIKTHIDAIQEFVRDVYIPDLLAVAGFYKDWAQWGAGVGNYLSYGDLPEGKTNDTSRLFLPRGAILNRDLTTVLDVDPKDENQVQEAVAHSWFKYQRKKDLLHPSEGETEANYTGPTPPYEHLNVDEKYSWLKAPRWRGNSMEVGPLSRMLIAYARKHPQVTEKVNLALQKLEVTPEALFSTLGRTAARGIEAWVVSEYLSQIYDKAISLIKLGDTSTFNNTHWNPETWPKEASGFGYMEAPRGALGHWVSIVEEKIAHYQIVVPSTWNGGPRDAQDQPGPYEAALQGTPIANPEQPLEILRTVHSFDPCMACAAHVYDTEGNEIVKVKVC